MELSKQELMEKLKSTFPEFDKFGLQVDVSYDSDKKAWMAEVVKGDHVLQTHLEEKDVQECVQGEKCYNFGIQLGQFIRNYCEAGNECKL